MPLHLFSKGGDPVATRLEASVAALEERLTELQERLALAESGLRAEGERISELQEGAARVGRVPIVQVVPLGNLANRMIQLMVAHSIADKVPGCIIEGAQLPEWGVAAAPASAAGPRTIETGGQWVPVERLAQMLRSGQVDRVVLNAYGQHMVNFLPLERHRGFFCADPLITRGFGADELVINVRGGEILSAPHPAYVLLPIDFYAAMIERTGLRPVFLGQLTPSPYMDALRQRFPDATYVDSRGPIVDFETVRRSQNILTSVSTFSWLAAWLSEASRIILPLDGLFNPMQCPDVDLIPRNDPRYSFFLFPINFATPVEHYAAAHAALANSWREVTPDEVLIARDRRPSEPRLVEEYLAQFDPAFYVRRYPDVADVVASGYMASPEVHYRAAGFAENREILELDPPHYSRKNPEAAKAVSDGRYLDFLHHYVREGHAAGAELRPAETF